MKRLAKALTTPALIIAPAAVALVLGAIVGGADFLRQHWMPLVLGGGVLGIALRFAVSLVAMTGRGVVRFGKQRQELGESGAVMTEFVIVLMPFLLVLFGIMQMAMISMGRILVSYAAFAAARAAIVIVPEQRNDELPNKLNTNLMASSKISAIRNAAAYAMIPSSPPIDQVANEFAQTFTQNLHDQGMDAINDVARDAFGNMIGGIIGGLASGPMGALRDSIMQQFLEANTSGQKGSVARAFEKDGWGGMETGVEGAIKRALRKFIYSRMATIVQLQSEEGGMRYAFKWNDPIRAKVTFLFMCRIPIANWFAGKRFHELPPQTMEAVNTSSLLQPMVSLGGVPGYYIGLSASHILINQGRP